MPLGWLRTLETLTLNLWQFGIAFPGADRTMVTPRRISAMALRLLRETVARLPVDIRQPSTKLFYLSGHLSKAMSVATYAGILKVLAHPAPNPMDPTIY